MSNCTVVYQAIKEYLSEINDWNNNIKCQNDENIRDSNGKYIFGNYVCKLSQEDGQYYTDRYVNIEHADYIKSISTDMAPGYNKPQSSHMNIHHLPILLNEETIEKEDILISIKSAFEKYLETLLLPKPFIDNEGI